MIIDIKHVLEEVGIKVLEIFDILDYSENMGQLLHDLKKYSDHRFLPNERILFIHGEPEFIFNSIRFDLYNIQTVIHAAGIPNFACIIVSQQDLHKDLELYREKLTSEIVPIGFINTECHLLHLLDFNIDLTRYDLNINFLEKQFIFLSNNPRPNKTNMFNWLEHNNLLDKSLTSFKNIKIHSINDTNKNESVPANNITLIQTVPYTRSCEKWNVKDPLLNQIFSKQPVNEYKNFIEPENTKIRYNNSSLLQKAFCYVSNETTFNYPTFTTEKTFKSLPAMRPMISYGGAGCLAKLKDLGFKTWDRWWSEEYDNIQNPEQRFIEVSNLIKSVSEFSLKQCKDMLIQMIPILEHNRDLYISSFIDNQISLIKKQAIKNLGKKC